MFAISKFGLFRDVLRLRFPILPVVYTSTSTWPFLKNVNSQCLTFAIWALYNIDSSRYKFTALVPVVPLPSAVFFKTHNRPGHCSIGCIDSSTLGSDARGNRVCSSNIRVCNALMKGGLYYFDVSCRQDKRVLSAWL